MKSNVSYIAAYESAAKVSAAATALGIAAGEPVLDHIEIQDGNYAKIKNFTNLKKAVAWLRNEVTAGRTFFGVGDVTQMQHREKRCGYCTCAGSVPRHRWVVAEDGVESDEVCDDPCLDRRSG